MTLLAVAPAKAGVQGNRRRSPWVPAFAGTMEKKPFSFGGDARMTVQGITIGRFDVGARFARWRAAPVGWRIILFCYLTLAPVPPPFLYFRLIPIALSALLHLHPRGLPPP